MKQTRLPKLPCLCSSLRRAARAVTHIYEEALRPVGLRVTQFTILQTLERTGEVLQGRLGELLAMDSTSLTRTLKIMVRQGWVAERRGKDRRERWLRLSQDGAEQMARALPVWEETQAMLREKLGEALWNGLLETTWHLASVANDQPSQPTGGTI